MATRYWVGGIGNWDATTTTNWSTTSGGSGGASAPTSADDVIFDTNSFSGAQQAKVIGAAVARNITGTAVTLITTSIQIASGQSLSVYGDIALGKIGTVGLGTTGIDMYGSTATYTIGAGTLNANTNIKSGASVTFAGSNYVLFSSNTLTIDGSLDTGSFNLSGSFSMIVNGSLTAGTSTLTLGNWTAASGSTLSVASATFIMSTFSGAILFAGGGKTYPNLTYNGGATLTFTITGANTFGNLTVKSGGSTTTTLVLPASTTTTITGTLTFTGFSGHLLTLTSSSSGTQATISSAGTIAVTYASIKDSNATGGASFNTSNSTDAGSNTGWIFAVLPVYTRDSLNTLPTNSNNLTIVYSSGEVTTVSTIGNTTPVDELGNKTYLLHQFKFVVPNNTDPLTPIWIGKTTRPATVSPVVMQIWNNTSSSWSTLTSNSTATSGSTFTLSATQSSSISSYVDGSNLVYVRIYQ